MNYGGYKMNKAINIFLMLIVVISLVFIVSCEQTVEESIEESEFSDELAELEELDQLLEEEIDFSELDQLEIE